MAERERYPILSVEQAQERILALVTPTPSEQVPILQALDRVLSEDVTADRDVPPLDNSAMDGYALRAADAAGATNDQPVALRIVAELAAGQTLERPVGAGEAVRIMTGAPLPPGADAVVRFEECRVAAEGRPGDQVCVCVAPHVGMNVRYAGEDVRGGSVVLSSGTVLRPQEIGMLASVGRAQAWVHRRPRVALLATGDEVVDVLDAPAPGQIRNINSYTNAAQVLRWGGEPLMLGIARDRSAELSARMHAALEQGADMVVTSGGVSAGDFDLVKRVLAREGQMDFWWVNMKPGRPMAFGTLGGLPLLALPGNPVSAALSLWLFGRPAIRKMLGYTAWEWPAVTARLREPVGRKDGRRHYLRVRLVDGPEGREAVLTGDQGSGILSSLVAADGLAVIPEACDHLEAGSLVNVLLLN
jgi:molybdopterin molybdotransferase